MQQSGVRESKLSDWERDQMTGMEGMTWLECKYKKYKVYNGNMKQVNRK